MAGVNRADRLMSELPLVLKPAQGSRFVLSRNAC
jgi:hypothetical protein